jgi:hypothetical protein
MDSSAQSPSAAFFAVEQRGKLEPAKRDTFGAMNNMGHPDKQSALR